MLNCLVIWNNCIIFVNLILKVCDMKRVELQIKASDILGTSYFNFRNCAITRALQRAGLPYIDAGTSIRFEGTDNDVNINIEEHKELADKVSKLYRLDIDNPMIVDFYPYL